MFLIKSAYDENKITSPENGVQKSVSLKDIL